MGLTTIKGFPPPVPRFYLDLTSVQGGATDRDGLDLPDQSAARVVAIDSIRGIVSEEARQGLIDMTGKIDIRDADGNSLLRVGFAEAFLLRRP